MNNELVEPLAEAIVALPEEDYALFQSALVARMVRKMPGVTGDHAYIRKTRIAVWTLISLAQQGADDGELALHFPGLTQFDFVAVRSYYAANRVEIDGAIAPHDRE